MDGLQCSRGQLIEDARIGGPRRHHAPRPSDGERRRVVQAEQLRLEFIAALLNGEEMWIRRNGLCFKFHNRRARVVRAPRRRALSLEAHVFPTAPRALPRDALSGCDNSACGVYTIRYPALCTRRQKSTSLNPTARVSS